MKLTATSKIIDLKEFASLGISASISKKLAAAVANYVGKTDIEAATVNDLLSYHPMRYEDRSNLIGVDQLYDGLEASLELFVRVSGGYQVGKNRPRRSPPLFIFEITASDKDRKFKPVVVWWFVSGKSASHIVNYWRDRFRQGTRFVAYGKWEWDTRRNTFTLKLAKPDELEILPNELESDGVEEGSVSAEDGLVKSNYKEVTEDKMLDEDRGTKKLAGVHVGRCVPIYRKFGQFQTKRLREIIFSVLERVEVDSFVDRIPAEIRERQSLSDYFSAIKEIHFPPEGANLVQYVGFRSSAQVRLIFEEFFWTLLLLGFKRGVRGRERKLVKFEIGGDLEREMERSIPFELTGAQRRVTREILGDMVSDSPMNRLVQGDVGSGKTIVAFLAIYAAAKSGFQSVLMAPTEILAEQHYRNSRLFFEESGIRVGLLTGSIRAADKRKLKAAIEAGEIDLVIGTHAIIQDGVEFDKLGLVIIDEQHRFGVLQRAQLKESGLNPDVIVMTATPIPRSLAMTVYGDLDVSVIDEMPPGRVPVKTVVVGEDQRSGVYKGISREVNSGRQVYIVYPLVSESEKLDLKAATEMYDDLRSKIFPDFAIGLLHGKMKAAEKDEVMSKFVEGEIDILVSTTVIEVGVDVPNATLMVIEHAERFGLSQLHQLRGRVGRGSNQSFCVLLTDDKKTNVAKERLGVMEKSSDGFVIAEKDLEIRGQGEILGTRQSGLQSFKLANIVRDLKILNNAKIESEGVLGKQNEGSEVSRIINDVKNDPRYDYLDFA